MPANKNFARKQLERFASFPGYPQSLPELQERAEYLADVSPNDRQCKEIADRMFRKLRYFPLPVDMDIAAEAGVPKEWEGPDVRLNPIDKISGDGWFYAELEPELIEETFRMLDSPRKEVRKFAEQVLSGLIANGRLTQEGVMNRSLNDLKSIGGRRR